MRGRGLFVLVDVAGEAKMVKKLPQHVLARQLLVEQMTSESPSATAQLAIRLLGRVGPPSSLVGSASPAWPQILVMVAVAVMYP